MIHKILENLTTGLLQAGSSWLHFSLEKNIPSHPPSPSTGPQSSSSWCISMSGDGSASPSKADPKQRMGNASWNVPLASSGASSRWVTSPSTPSLPISFVSCQCFSFLTNWTKRGCPEHYDSALRKNPLVIPPPCLHLQIPFPEMGFTGWPQPGSPFPNRGHLLALGERRLASPGPWASHFVEHRRKKTLPGAQERGMCGARHGLTQQFPVVSIREVSQEEQNPDTRTPRGPILSIQLRNPLKPTK